MKKQLHKMFYACLPAGMAIFVTAMLFSVSANAQFVYTDVIPDVSKTCTGTCSQTDSVDINNDGVFDLKLKLSKSGGSGSAMATPLNGSAIKRNSGFPLKLYRHDSINSTGNWSTTANQTLLSVVPSGPMGGFTVTGNWGPQIDGFLGIKIIAGSQTFYAWIRLHIAVNSQSASFTYKEFAYDSIPNQAILAGQTSAIVIVAPFVNIPDAAFKSRLVNNGAINTDIDREIQFTEAAAFTGQLNVSSGSSISNLTGIEAFTALTYLHCGSNNLTSLDLSANTALTYLNCGYNQLASLNVSANTALTTLYCSNNQLTSLDVSANTALITFYCASNQLTSLDVSNITALIGLYCYNNQLTSLDVSANAAFEILYCANNQITTLSFSNSLNYLSCENNQLSSLDVSANTALWRLVCGSNQLTSLNVKNGNNVNFNYFDAQNNPNLTCIQVDNVAYSNANWSANIDAGASFSTNCGVTSVTEIDKSASLEIFPNPASDLVTMNGLNNIQKVELINMQGQIVKTIWVNGISSVLDVKSIANGIYQLKLSSSNHSQIKKLVVEH